jgi:hypothetical protein
VQDKAPEKPTEKGQEKEPEPGKEAAKEPPKEFDPFSPEAIEAEFARLLGRMPSKSDG